MLITRLATTPDTQAAAYGARHRAYCETHLMHCPLDGPPFDVRHDAYDASPKTALYVVDDGYQVIGSARLVAFDPALRHQFEAFFRLPPDMKPEGYREISRLALDPAYTNERLRSLALLTLLGQVVRDSIEDGCTTWIMTMRGGVLGKLSSLSMPFCLLDAEPVISDGGGKHTGPLSGEPLFPASLDLRELGVAMYAGSRAAYEIMFATQEEPRLMPAGNAAELLDRVGNNRATLRGLLAAWRAQNA